MSKGFFVEQPGAHSILLDSGRFGQAHLGLTSGGPADGYAYRMLNRLLGNELNATVIETTFGGLKVHCDTEQVIAVTGADMPLMINGERKPNWCCHRVYKGDCIELGYASSGVRGYLGVSQGFDISPSFGSTSTVVREAVGGIKGKAIEKNDWLPLNAMVPKPLLTMPINKTPRYAKSVNLRLVLGYQHNEFSRIEKKHFFSQQYQVSKQWDRMGYRLSGYAIKHEIKTMLSEGITYGAVQVPADGQPIVLLNDRQTIGGYPKLGTVLSIDAYQLAQCGQGAMVTFEPISIEKADNLLHLAAVAERNMQLVPVKEC